MASLKGHKEVVELLLNYGVEDINKGTSDYGFTSLYSASQNGDLVIVKKLVESGANVNQALAMGDTPLYIAAFNGFYDVCEYLLEKGALLGKLGW